MEEIVIRPSMKLIRTGYTTVFVVLFLAVLTYTNSESLRSSPPWLLAFPALLLIWPLKYHLRRNFTRMTIGQDKLRYETGILNRSSRTIQVSKVQNVRVDQRLGQRIIRTGNLSIETAGETSLLTIENIDDPQRVADEVIDAARRRKRKGKEG